MYVLNFIRKDSTLKGVIVVVKRVLNVAGDVNIQVLFKLQLFAVVKKTQWQDVFFQVDMLK